VSADVICLRPETDFLEVGVHAPAGLKVTYAEEPLEVPPDDLATARAVLLASVGPRLERGWLDKIPNLRLVQFTGAGVDRVGDACAHRPDVIVAGVPAANAREVAEYVLFAAGILLRGLAFADRGIRDGRYAGTRARLTPRYVKSLHSRTAGVVGLGQIGLATARLLRAAGATVVYADPAPRDIGAAAALGLDRLGLDDLLARCDLVTLHVPLLPSTRGLLGEAQLRRMPRGALLINASRGGVVDEEALARVLIDGHLGGAAVDVYEAEPPAPDSALLTLPPPVADRVLFTPHIAGVAYEAAQALYTRAWENARRVLGAEGGS
jgi:phosphoglycerate dehydrogenase-like enzyme